MLPSYGSSLLSLPPASSGLRSTTGKPSATDTKLLQAISRLSVPRERHLALNDLCSLVGSNMPSRAALATYILTTNRLLNSLEHFAEEFITIGLHKLVPEESMFTQSSNVLNMLKYVLDNQRIRAKLKISPLFEKLVKSYIMIIYCKQEDDDTCNDIAEHILILLKFIMEYCKFSMSDEHGGLMEFLIDKCQLWKLILPGLTIKDCRIVEACCEIITHVARSNYKESCNEKIIHIYHAMSFVGELPRDEYGNFIGDSGRIIFNFKETIIEILSDDRLGQLIIENEGGIEWMKQTIQPASCLKKSTTTKCKPTMKYMGDLETPQPLPKKNTTYRRQELTKKPDIPMRDIRYPYYQALPITNNNSVRSNQIQGLPVPSLPVRQSTSTFMTPGRSPALKTSCTLPLLNFKRFYLNPPSLIPSPLPDYKKY